MLLFQRQICMNGAIGSRSTFESLRSSRNRARSGAVRITFVDGEEFDRSCVAYAISRKVGKAVVRNLIRRRLRSIVGELSSTMSVGAYLISVSPEAASLSYGELKADVSAVMTVVERRIKQ